MVGVTVGSSHQSQYRQSLYVGPPVSHRTAQHQEYYNWVRDIFDEWKRTLDFDGGRA